MADRKQLIPIIVGPTAVGKTSVAIEIARFFPITVISADSRQVYRKLDIGTAKPTLEEQELAPHLGLDVVEPGERYSAGRFASDAAAWIRSVPDYRQAIVVGGTGFYVRALAEGLFREPPMDDDRRTRLRQWTDRVESLSRWAARLDPEFRGGGKQRSARAVEVAVLTGRPLSWWQKRATVESPIFPWYVRLTSPRAVLHRRIADRARGMIANGLVEEVKALIEQGIPSNAPGLDAVGYREVVALLDGGIGPDELVSKISINTRRYAKRQETWFRHQLRGSEVQLMDVTDGAEAVAERIVELWTKRKEKCASE